MGTDYDFSLTTLMNPKTDPAFPCPQWQNRNGELLGPYIGLSQYAYVAMHFHEAFISTLETEGDIARVSLAAFRHADVFFAELAKRTK